MKTNLLLLIATGLLLSSCDKTSVGKALPDDSQPGAPKPGAPSSCDFEELMKLSGSDEMMKLWVYNKTETIPAEAFDVPPPQITVDRVSKDLFEVRAVYEATAKSDLYSFSVPVLVDEGGKTTAYMVTELLDKNGAKKVRYFECQVRYGPMNRGANPDKIKWNWEKPKESGDDMETYTFSGPYRWATAESLQINPEGTASTKPDILIQGTPDYLKAVEKHPRLAVTDEQRRKEESEHFDRLYQSIPRKSR